MTRLLEDLEIWEHVLPETVLGSLDFGALDWLGLAQSDEDVFVLQIQKDIPDDQILSTVCHELEHYDVGHALLNQKILTKKIFEYQVSGDVATRRFKEWLHSDPSFYNE